VPAVLYMAPWARTSLPPNGISIGSAVFVSLTGEPNRQIGTSDSATRIATGRSLMLCVRCGLITTQMTTRCLRAP